jgi:hypothetical protein
MLSHIKAQPEWIKWRNAPLEQRPSLGRSIAKHFHPDKWNDFNPTCDIDHSGAWLAAHGVASWRSCCKKSDCDCVCFAGKWAERISQAVVDLIMKDRDAIKQKQK